MYIEALSQWWSSMMFSHRSAKIPKEAREGDLTGASKVPGRSAKDPGHLLASLNCASAQAEEDGSSGLAMQRHDFALDSSVGPGVFSTSKVASWTLPTLPAFAIR